MELRTFVAQTLVDILDAVKDAQTQTPAGSIVPAELSNYQAVQRGVSALTTVEFEVSVNASESSDSIAKVNVVTGLIGGGVSKGKGITDEHAAVLKFRIPLKLPVSPVEAE